IACVKLVCNSLFGQLIRTAALVNQSPYCCTCGVDHFGSSAVVQSDRQDHSLVSRRLFRRTLNLFANILGECADSSDCLEPDVLTIDLVELESQVTPQHAHQCVDFVTRSFPVLG